MVRLPARAAGVQVARAFAWWPAWLAVAALLGMVACGSGNGTVAEGDGGSHVAVAEPPPYVVRPLEHWGRVTGLVTADRSLDRDSTVIPIGAEGDCGARLRVPAVVVHGGRLVGAVVSLDAREGKPLPVSRRFELSHQDCTLEPHLQAVVVGGTLNVKSGDAAVVRLRFGRAPGDSTLAMVRQTDAGQVVPVTGLFQRAETIEVSSDTQPWMRAWIRVFDQPYFDVTARSGTFRLDSVPAGTYRLTVWHDRLGTRTRTVRVRAGEETRVTVDY